MPRADFPVRILHATADAEELQELAYNLREALLDSDVDDVRPATTDSPAGAKSGQALAVGTLIVTLAPTVAEHVMAVISSWLSRQSSEIELEIDGKRFQGRVTRSERAELVAAWLRHVDREP
ncbi:hypothetical protein JIG36_12790 [Actinoplanes sp. LDG1-06]|uniref:Uncharacterized protein n=1 Tax=Paractinoplanes ovalisporus TaxID=2810368 RepID=A0ABS2A9C5_9ACTN|nr:hypothetical protein [Actinoplanes ovalisporus]MBM2616435.1 hypothetical protein [Actinoplanes ovalisporus]